MSKIKLLEKNIDTAWDFVFNKLYYKKTGMFYDCYFGDIIEESLKHLPTLDEIKKNIPNPCGWNTGMEDSTLNTGSLIEAVLARYEVTKDAKMKEYADILFRALEICATVAGEAGFVARCVSFEDGKTCYIDSSRDQYTLWVYGAYLFINSSIIDEEKKNRLRELIVNVASKAERDLKLDNGGYLTRLDGRPGIVSRIYSDDIGPHELLRLPMFYMAAYNASGDKYWLDKYLEIREELLSKNEARFTVDVVKEWAHMEFGHICGTHQQQYSARLLYDCETDADYKKRYLNMLVRGAEIAEEYMRVAYSKIDALATDQPPIDDWRSVPADYEYFEGFAYYVPRMHQSDINQIFKYAKNAADVISIQCLCPDYKTPNWVIDNFLEFVERLHFDTANTYWPIAYCDAWWRAKQLNKI